MGLNALTGDPFGVTRLMPIIATIMDVGITLKAALASTLGQEPASLVAAADLVGRRLASIPPAITTAGPPDMTITCTAHALVPV